MPINIFEKCMFFQLCCIALSAKSMFRIPVKKLWMKISMTKILNASKKKTHPFDKLFPIIIDDAFRKTDLAKTNVLVHLLSIFRIKRAPSTAHFE